MISLSDIQSATAKKYAPLEIQLPDGSILSLRPALRLDKATRAKLREQQAVRERWQAAADASQETGVDAPEFDTDEYLRGFIRIVADDAEKAEKLLELVGEDIAVLSEIVSEYSEQTQPGEASPSES